MKPTLTFIYVNYKGEAGVRTVKDPHLVFRDSAWHGEENQPVWMLEGFDCDKNADREFLMADILRIID